MEKLALVALGGGIGATARYAVGLQSVRWFGAGWPYGTFAANLIGGLLIGALAGAIAQRGAELERLWLFLGVGVLGGFTTFSAFSLETWLMIERRAVGQALGYASLSVALSIGAVFAGLLLARRAFA